MSLKIAEVAASAVAGADALMMSFLMNRVVLLWRRVA